MSQLPELPSPRPSCVVRSAIRICEKLGEDNWNGAFSGREPTATLSAKGVKLLKWVSAAMAPVEPAVIMSAPETRALIFFCLNIRNLQRIERAGCLMMYWQSGCLRRPSSAAQIPDFPAPPCDGCGFYGTVKNIACRCDRMSVGGAHSCSLFGSGDVGFGP